ncbi:hypothetical protein ACX80C_08905 [Arthrobacter tecti]
MAGTSKRKSLKKSTLLTMIATPLLLVGCGGEKLSTADTCAELRVLIVDYPSSPDEEFSAQFSSDLEELSKRSSDAIADELAAVAEYENAYGEGEYADYDTRQAAMERISAACEFES